MKITDPIADMFTRIRNALMVDHQDVIIPYSKEKAAIAKILKEEGFIKFSEVLNNEKNQKIIKVGLKYDEHKKSVITKIERISKPGKRIYVKKKDVPKVLNGFGISILSTSLGILTGQAARINNTGGELLGIVY
jgi:small subunit ribosomal protein S8